MRCTFQIGLVVGILGLTAPALGQECEVGGLILEDTTWDPNDCPDGFVVTSSIVIGADATLTILPDTLVRVQHGLGFSVGGDVWGPGTLIARGTEESPIVFTSDDPYQDPNDPAQPGDWVRIDFTDYATDAEFDPNTAEYVSGCVLEHVVVEYAGSDAGPAVRATSCSPYLRHCEVHDNAQQGISVDSSDAGDVKIEHCVVRDNAGSGIGVNASTGGAVEIQYCDLVNNTPGRGIYLNASGVFPATIEYCNISGSSVDSHGAGIYLTGGADHMVRGNLVQNCAATGSNHYAGGMMIWVRTTLEDNTVSNNTAYCGGGICLWENSDGSTLVSNQVTANKATGDHSDRGGGGIYAYNSGSCTLTGNTFADNWTTHRDGTGGGICLCSSGSSILTENTVTGNTTSGQYACGAGICLRASTNCLLEHNIVTANGTSGQDAHGAGIYLRDGGTGTGENRGFRSNTISENATTGTNAGGGGIYLTNSGNSVFESNTVTNNHASGSVGCGGGIFLVSSSGCPFNSNIITGNTCGNGGGGVYLSSSPNCQPFSANTITGNACGDQGGGMVLASSGGATLTSNTISDNTANNVGGLHFWSSGNCAMTDCVIVGNEATSGSIGGIYVGGPSENMSFAGDPECSSYNTFACCPDTYAIYNGNPYDDSGIYDIDARYNIWCTDDMQVIQDCIYDYFDDASKGFVYFCPFCERIPGDVDADWDVDHSDLGAFLGAWCAHEGDPNWNPDADFDADGHVGHSDLGILLGHWGEACPECP